MLCISISFIHKHILTYCLVECNLILNTSTDKYWKYQKYHIFDIFEKYRDIFQPCFTLNWNMKHWITCHLGEAVWDQNIDNHQLLPSTLTPLVHPRFSLLAVSVKEKYRADTTAQFYYQRCNNLKQCGKMVITPDINKVVMPSNPGQVAMLHITNHSGQLSLPSLRRERK